MAVIVDINVINFEVTPMEINIRRTKDIKSQKGMHLRSVSTVKKFEVVATSAT